MTPTTMPTSRIERVGSRERVGAFETLDGAALAVSHLVELDYDPMTVAIAPREFAVVEPQRLRDRIGPAVRRGAVRVVAVAMAITIVVSLGIDTMVRTVLPVALIAAAAGAAIGLVGAIREHRCARFLALPGRPPELRPASFDVLVDREGITARRDLARWWDPAAKPTQAAA